MAGSSDSNKTGRVFKDTIFAEKGCGSSNPEGKFHYNEDRMIDEFVKYLNLDNLPLNTSASDCFEKFVQRSLQPACKKVPLIVASYRNDKQVLKDYFVNFDGHVAVTADLWSSEWGERFVCVTCHWIDGSWKRQNRVIGFWIISDDATSVDVCGEIIDVLDVFELRDKVLGISLGKSLHSKECVVYLTNELHFVMKELFVYNDRSCAYVANLCAQHGMEQLRLLINPIRDLIRWIRSSSCNHGLVFRQMCKEVGLDRVYFPLDYATNWRSTYEMLCLVFPYKEIVTKLYKDNGGELNFQWDSISSLIQLFGKFNDAIHRFSSVYESNCELVVQECIHIVHELKMYENDPLLCLVVRSMRCKWVEYLPDVPVIYCIGTMLDPRVKREGLSRLLEYYYETLGAACCLEKILDCGDLILYIIYSHYAVRMKTLKKGNDMDHSSIESIVIRNIVKKKSVGGQSYSMELDELDYYLSIEHVIPKEFDILQWWKSKEEAFPIVSKVAKDVLCMPVSTVALESVFTTAGYGEGVLNEQWSMISPSEIQACICKRDWDRAEKRAQRYVPTIDTADPYIDTSDSESE